MDLSKSRTSSNVVDMRTSGLFDKNFGKKYEQALRGAMSPYLRNKEPLKNVRPEVEYAFEPNPYLKNLQDTNKPQSLKKD